MHHKESELQIRCVKYFRAKYPAFAKLLFHPKNEEASGSRSRGAISKAEGVVAGVADLLLLVPTESHISLAIEMKTKTGRQSPAQKSFQQYAEASGLEYAIVRSYDDFTAIVDNYMGHIKSEPHIAIKQAHLSERKAQTEEARKKFQQLVGKSTSK